MEWFHNLKLSNKIVLLTIIKALLFILVIITAFYTRNIVIVSLLIVISFFLSVVISLFLFNKIVEPISAATVKLKGILKGKPEVQPLQIKSKDEIGELYETINNLVDNVESSIDRERLLRQIIIDSISTLEFKEVLRTIVTRTGKLFNAERCYFISYDNNKGEYLPIEDHQIYTSSINIKNLAGFQKINEQWQPFSKNLLSQRQIIAISNIDEIELSETSKKLFNEFGIKCFLAAPMFYKDNIIGILVVDYDETGERTFSQDDKNLLSSLANQSAILIYQSSLYNQILEAKNVENLLRSFINNILMSESLDQAFQFITSELLKLFKVDRVSIRYFDPLLRSFSEAIKESKKNENIPSAINKSMLTNEIENYIVNEIFDKGNLLVVNNVEDIKHNELFKKFLQDFEIKSSVIVPIIYRDIPIGAIFLTNVESSRQWNVDELEFLKLIIKQISIGIYLFRLNNELNKTLDAEKMTRELLFEIRHFKEEEQIFKVLLEKLTGLFDVNRSLYIYFDENNNFFVKNEMIIDQTLAPAIGHDISNIKNTKELIPFSPNEIVIINNVEKEIQNVELKEYFRSKNINALVMYPVVKRTDPVEEVIGIVMVASSFEKKWNDKEIASLKLLVDAATLVWLEAKQRAEAEELRNTFLATLTHDLRSPLYAEQKALEYILAQNIDTPLNKIYEFFEDMHKTNDELLRIVNNILIGYHYETGKFVLKPELCYIKDIIDEAVTLSKYLAKEKSSEIKLNIQENLPCIEVDKTEIARVIINLLNNAIRHTRQNTEIFISAERIDDKIQVLVRDNGMGIPELDKNKIFHRFPTAKSTIGTGLGLYVAKQIIDAHKGRIWFETEENIGSTFYFILPISAQ